MLDSALDPYAERPVAARCATIRTRAVTHRTSLLLVRMRFHLGLRPGDGHERALLAEDARLLAFTGSPDAPAWLNDEQAEALLAAVPDANISPEQAARLAARLVDALPALARRSTRPRASAPKSCSRPIAASARAPARAAASRSRPSCPSTCSAPTSSCPPLTSSPRDATARS